MPLSPEQARRVRQALDETERFIAKEQPRRADLRPQDMQKALDHAIGHRAKLQGMLDGTVAFPTVTYEGA